MDIKVRLVASYVPTIVPHKEPTSIYYLVILTIAHVSHFLNSQFPS